VPPSVNHYVQHFKGGVHVVSEEAKAFKLAVYIFGRDQPTFSGKNTTYSVFLAIYLAKGQKGDIDNFPKLILDGLRDAKIIHSDAAVMCLHIELFRDPANPRTEITVDARRAR
jgi:Holliday junction resolvase RusA-like endonuclease